MDPSALLEAVLAAPEDDAPRLVYADWLLEHERASSRARGEYIQLACAIARLADEPTAERATLVRRAMELLGAWELSWVDELLAPVHRRRVWHAGAVDWRWSRGFIEAYRKPSGIFTFGDDLGWIQRYTPLLDVDVGFRELETLRSFLALPGLRHLRALSISLWASLGPEALTMIASTPALASLETLHVDWDGHDEVGALVSVPGAFPRLTSLALERSAVEAHPMPRRALEALAASPLAGTVRSLSLDRDVFGEALEDLVQLPFDLTRLRLRSNDAGPVLSLLAAKPEAYPNLRGLEVHMRYGRGAPWSTEGAGKLLESRTLERLELSDNDAPDLGQLLDLPEAGNLRALSLQHNQLDDRAVESLARATHLTRLRELDLGHNKITNDGAKRLVKAPHLQRLRRLGLRRCSRIGVSAFTAARGFGDLEHLDLRDNSLPEKSPALDKLRLRYGAAAVTGYDPDR